METGGLGLAVRQARKMALLQSGVEITDGQLLECFVVHREHAAFATGGAMMRAAAARDVGGYDVDCYHGEDAELGRRLLDRGYKVIFDPALVYWQTGSNTLAQVLERYWRWNRPAGGRMSFLAYLKQIKYSVMVMAREDMETADVGAALISLISPHYQFWRDRKR